MVEVMNSLLLYQIITRMRGNERIEYKHIQYAQEERERRIERNGKQWRLHNERMIRVCRNWQ